MAYADGFLAGAGFAQAAAAAADSAGLRETMTALTRTGRFRFPYARQRLRHPAQRLLLVGESPSAPHLVRFLGGEHIAHWSDD